MRQWQTLCPKTARDGHILCRAASLPRSRKEAKPIRQVQTRPLRHGCSAYPAAGAGEPLSRTWSERRMKGRTPKATRKDAAQGAALRIGSESWLCSPGLGLMVECGAAYAKASRPTGAWRKRQDRTCHASPRTPIKGTRWDVPARSRRITPPSLCPAHARAWHPRQDSPRRQ